MNSSTDTLASSLSASIANGADRLVDHAEKSIQESQRVANQAEDLARRGLERARLMTGQARERASALRDATATQVQAAPLKALLIAAAAGAATALVVQWLTQPRRDF